ncbi:hypothetical protein EDF66_10621 [Sphingobacterium sp. JUb20]|nr:hypothetical protein [Sphingobacterium sp. JUb21]TCR05554.1 hypothetical protein EDF66_10621 [Sphingobacterium sp. JUb20]
MNIFEEQYPDQGCPNMDVNGILGGAYKTGDLQPLLEVFKKRLDLPALFVYDIILFAWQAIESLPSSINLG